MPGYAYAPEHVRTDLLQPSAGPPRGGNVLLPKGPVSAWFDLLDGHRVIEHASWIRADAVQDRRLEEDKVLDAPSSSRHLTVALDGHLPADSRDLWLLVEIFLPTRNYVPARGRRLRPDHNRG
ncbi:hypothetical protein [Paeniglutamicibacter cryotolerans]|uniref:Uncharacterized protein n=1 Tax=Paeniglutamicibacter cryotolerans TaxID=670079 RepID=A0A839QSW7_9MICC|nr:hypothetical protein [Paeniglutamicibacter cryotolerans]MBB2996362.1 hypothetical protein [Paeniglutamicibacter cryotolerans]